MASIVAAAMDAFGSVDVVVNNTGIAAPLESVEDDLSNADYRRIVDPCSSSSSRVTRWQSLIDSDTQSATVADLRRMEFRCIRSCRRKWRSTHGRCWLK